MDDRDFELLVDRIEIAARARPGIYKAQLFGLAVLGYGFLAVVVAVLLGLIVAATPAIRHAPALAVKLLLGIGAFLLVVPRALWVKLEAPQGRILARADAPDLFKLLDRLRKALRTPPIHVVQVTSAFNAGVCQISAPGPIRLAPQLSARWAAARAGTHTRAIHCDPRS